MREVPLVGWYAGYIVAACVVALVVLLVAAMLAFARRIGVRALRISQELDGIRTLSGQDMASVGEALDQATESLGRIRVQRGQR